MKYKTIVVRPLVPWFDDELKSLKSQRRKAELVWRRSRNHETLLSFHRARNRFVNALNTRTSHLSLCQIPASDTHPFSILVFDCVSDRGSNVICALRDEERLDCFAHNILNTVLRNTFDEKMDCPLEITALLNAVKGAVRNIKKTGLSNLLSEGLTQCCETR